MLVLCYLTHMHMHCYHKKQEIQCAPAFAPKDNGNPIFFFFFSILRATYGNHFSIILHHFQARRTGLLEITKPALQLSWHLSYIEQTDDESHFGPAFEAHRCAEKSLMIMSVCSRQYIILGRMIRFARTQALAGYVPRAFAMSAAKQFSRRLSNRPRNNSRLSGQAEVRPVRSVDVAKMYGSLPGNLTELLIALRYYVLCLQDTVLSVNYGCAMSMCQYA